MALWRRRSSLQVAESTWRSWEMRFMSHSFEKLKIQEVNTIWMFSTSSRLRALHVNEHLRTILPLLQINFYKKNANVSNKYLWTWMRLLMRDHQMDQTYNLVESTKSCREEKGVLFINCHGQLMSARRRLPSQPPFVQVVIRKER